MELPLHITFHGLPGSKLITDKVRGRAQRLARFFDRIHSCRVAIEVPHPRDAAQEQYRVRVEVRVPGHQLVVTRPEGSQTHNDVAAALRDAFDAMRRQLEEYAALLRSSELLKRTA